MVVEDSLHEKRKGIGLLHAYIIPIILRPDIFSYLVALKGHKRDPYPSHRLVSCWTTFSLARVAWGKFGNAVLISVCSFYGGCFFDG